MDNNNIKDWLLAAERACGEVIESVVVGIHDNKKYDQPSPLTDENIVLSREEALAKLDLPFDAGFGGADCFPVYAWTKSRVFFIHEYDGATGLHWVPRNPISIAPDFSGESA